LHNASGMYAVLSVTTAVFGTLPPLVCSITAC
jgi:hypothetical protein